ncbi:thymidine kinase [Legionella anisa]|uniref:Thymidine kinase n=1 Tax=Legionella anisa TaxID=28082 RepID=A0AAX0WYS4_9GAMM|nr:thymidine kinase [Legionella anisa]AWN72855.1 thymidine kinase [Legionella anisa]KTC70697.1 thymidine kinase [Legionella anisa]MBN5934666.1 thymidine kinase [Legionella anisa]MCW8423659.1 thymidine kinase [Legionella anisa]MCW8447179.1 thymidine kinase [Legionella anisa]
MAKLYFYFAAMNAGKSTVLLQSSYNYRERGMETLLFTPAIDNRFQHGAIHSRIGLSEHALIFNPEDDLYKHVLMQEKKYACVLVDEAQFLTRVQVHQLTEITDQLGIPVLAYGLRTDFRGELFEGSQYLLAWADELVELKTICHCGRKATMILRLNAQGEVITEGEQVVIGGNNMYSSTCRKHFKRREPGCSLAIKERTVEDLI